MESIRSEFESLEATELRLGLPGTEKVCLKTITSRGNNKRSSPDSDDCKSSTNVTQIGIGQETNPPAKAQVVGWPPLRSFRKNTLQPKNNSEAMDLSSLPGLFVKVSMDGAPYLRKIDLNVYKGYKDLRNGLETMFRCFSTGENGSDLAIAYEDKDGDWMLAGDVPWEMFTSSCKRLRIMKGSEAKGLAPGNCD